MNDWFQSREGLLTRAWDELTKGAGGASTPGHRVVLATLNNSGGPETRIVVLRGADRARGFIQMHTDAKSVKVSELFADPRAAVHFWEEPLQLQLRLRGTMSVFAGPDVVDTWASIRQTARFSYGVKPTPGTPIAASDAYSRIPDPDQFAVLTLTIDDIDIVHLSDDYHRRARYLRSNSWEGNWLAP